MKTLDKLKYNLLSCLWAFGSSNKWCILPKLNELDLLTIPWTCRRNEYQMIEPSCMHPLISFPFLSFPFLSFPFLSFPFVSFRFVSFRFVSFRFVPVRFFSFRFVTFCYVSFHYVSFRFPRCRRCITVHSSFKEYLSILPTYRISLFEKKFCQVRTVLHRNKLF